MEAGGGVGTVGTGGNARLGFRGTVVNGAGGLGDAVGMGEAVGLGEAAGLGKGAAVGETVTLGETDGEMSGLGAAAGVGVGWARVIVVSKPCVHWVNRTIAITVIAANPIRQACLRLLITIFLKCWDCQNQTVLPHSPPLALPALPPTAPSS